MTVVYLDLARALSANRNAKAVIEPMCWQCNACGSASFKLMGDGSIKCWGCETVQSRGHFDLNERGPA